MTDKPIISGVTLEDNTIPAGAGWSRVLKRGEMMRIIDLEGKQAVDFLCWNANDHEDRYAAADTMKINDKGIFLGKDTTLYSVGLTPLFTIVEDSCGFHDTIGGCCSADLNKFRYDAENETGCRENFLSEMATYGLGKRDMAANVNFFMYVPVGKDGNMDMGPSLSKPGDFVDLRADSDVLAIISNCPQINNPVNDYNPTPVQVTVWRPT
ncbi:MAG: hypothetical protein CFH41_00766 [Alphaproteobacteria bacterium MarineAlpha11_Bin1]|nr:MAG: hypothetical protein CFH41_00766 [Alphaproteobacteria bacterium MarineAlpha11_Bin1]|tara:strand:+ start:14604 stop:15233 length:630 start_codon:yes stop_codon:yes gene_type:complete